jgi:hypothetical protein
MYFTVVVVNAVSIFGRDIDNEQSIQQSIAEQSKSMVEHLITFPQKLDFSSACCVTTDACEPLFGTSSFSSSAPYPMFPFSSLFCPL